MPSTSEFERALRDAGLRVTRSWVAVRAEFGIEPAGSVARYETRVGDDHAHMVCRVCGAIADVDSVLGSPACRSPADDAGFELERTEIVSWGLCPGCLSALNAGRRTDGPARPEKGPT